MLGLAPSIGGRIASLVLSPEHDAQLPSQAVATAMAIAAEEKAAGPTVTRHPCEKLDDPFTAQSWHSSSHTGSGFERVGCTTEMRHLVNITHSRARNKRGRRGTLQARPADCSLCSWQLLWTIMDYYGRFWRARSSRVL